jgi:hypothetical protein
MQLHLCIARINIIPKYISICVIHTREKFVANEAIAFYCDRLCGLVARVLGYRSGGPGSIPGTTRKKK